MRLFTTARTKSEAILAAVLASALFPSPLRAQPAPAPFTQPVIVNNANNLGEPGIKVAADGTLYLNAPAGLVTASFLYRSDDAGASWIETDPGLRAGLPGGGDSDVALDPVDGTIYFTDLYLADSTVSVSHDQGNTWSFADPVGGLPVQDRQWLATSGGGTVYHVYNQIPTGLWVSKSIDGGVTYPLHSVAATLTQRNFCICPPGNLIAESQSGGQGLLSSRLGGLDSLSDHIGVIYAIDTGGIAFSSSSDGALTWGQSVVSPAGAALDTTLSFPVVANAGNGQLKAAWLEATGNSTRVQFSASTDWGATWTAPVTLVNSGTSVFPWIDARGGKVSLVLYYNSAAADRPDDVPAGNPWFAVYAESQDGGATWSGFETVDSTPVKSGPICTQGANCTANRELLDFLQVAIDPASRANVTWTRSLDNVSKTAILFARQSE